MLLISFLFSKLYCSHSDNYGSGIKSIGREEFNLIFDRLVADVIESVEVEVAKDAAIWIRTMINYTVPGGKQNRGLSVINAYQHLAGHPLSETEIKQTYVLGWCIEWLQAFFLVADDIMDKSMMRRGKQCWYLKEEVGTIAINDAFILESCVFVLLKKFFRHHTHYIEMVELFHEIILKTEVGQVLDLLSSKDNMINYDLFTHERYISIVNYKTAFYSFYLPIASAMYLHGIDNPFVHNDAKAILLKMGEYFQIQDDFLDCFGDPIEMGKVGTDIEEGKCSWLAIQAMQLMNSSQKEIFKEYYGQIEEESVNIIKKIYRELDIQFIFREYENESYQQICGMINDNKTNLPKDMFFDFLNKIYKRKA